MKTFLLSVFTVTALFIWQRHDGEAISASKLNVETSVAAPVASRPVSEHNWAKHSIDRAHEVADQVRQSRAENEQP